MLGFTRSTRAASTLSGNPVACERSSEFMESVGLPSDFGAHTGDMLLVQFQVLLPVTGGAGSAGETILRAVSSLLTHPCRAKCCQQEEFRLHLG